MSETQNCELFNVFYLRLYKLPIKTSKQRPTKTTKDQHLTFVNKYINGSNIRSPQIYQN